MYYFFANSYFQLYHALDLDFNNEQKVTIITRNIAIEKFCRHISKKVICYNRSPKYATFRVHKELKHLIKIKSEAKEFIESINFNKDDTIIYPLKYFQIYQAGNDSYLLKIISNIANVYFMNITDRSKFIKTSLRNVKIRINRIRVRYLRLLYYMVFGVKFSYYKIDSENNIYKKIYLRLNNENIGVDNIALSNYNHDHMESINNVINKFDNLITEQYDHLIIYEGDGKGLDSQFSISSIENLYRYLFSRINSFGIKRSPKVLQGLKNQLNIDIEKNYNCLPTHLPSELLLKNINKSVISISSATLINASGYKNLKLVSLLELVSWHDQNRKIGEKNFLLKNGKNILFPKNYDELIQLLL